MYPAKKTRKIAMATSVASMSVGLITAFCLNARAAATGGGEKGPSQIVECSGFTNAHHTVCNNTNSTACAPSTCTND